MPGCETATEGDDMAELQSQFLGELRIEIGGSHIFGETPQGRMRRVDWFENGSFRGPGIQAEILKGSADGLLQRYDGVVQPNVRLVLRTDDDCHLYIEYRGYRHAAPDIMARIAAGEIVPGDQVYLRTALFFGRTAKNTRSSTARSPSASAGANRTPRSTRSSKSSETAHDGTGALR